MNFFLVPEKYRRWIPVILSVMTGVTGALLVWAIVPLYPIMAITVGFILGFSGMLLFISLIVHFFALRTKAVNSQFDDVFKLISEAEIELRSMINIRPLLGSTFVPFGEWSINGRFGEILVRLLLEMRPGLVLECGSGTSTVLAAHCLKQIDIGKIISLEHIGTFASAARQRLKEDGLDEVSSVLETPLREWPINGEEALWYTFDPKAHLQQKIDMLIVDGPPGKTGPLARYPAVPLLKEWLSPDAVIILDDGNREAEREIARRWIDELNATFEFHPEGKGIWIIRPQQR